MNEIKLSKAISAVFHPLHLPLLGFLLVLYSDAYLAISLSSRAIWLTLTLIITNTAFLPSLVTWMIQRSQGKMDWTLKRPRDRDVPYLFTAIVYGFTAYLLSSQPTSIGNSVIPVFIAGGAISIALLFIISLFWKMSAHMVGVGGLIGGLHGVGQVDEIDQSFLLAILFSVAAGIGYARLRLAAHRPWEVYMGFVMGLIVTYLTVVLGSS